MILRVLWWVYVCTTVVIGSAFGAVGSRPDIVLFMADDMGFSDIASYGGEIATPNIDRLATNGLRFTQLHYAARSCPTRASLYDSWARRADDVTDWAVLQKTEDQLRP